MSAQPRETGVYTTTRKDGSTYYRSSLTHKRKHVSLGSFDTWKMAHEAYLEGQRLLASPDLPIHSYDSSSPLSFEKWVILINLRDNGIYLGKPVYLGQKMFSYYLSPTKILKFDLDDLFFYSSHKIMCRGNHYFVAHYGMQLNIASRYGIKNYAVPGRDYCFLNGDSLDFRRVNLQILNAFHGVTETQKKEQCIYTARIHVRGNYVIGHYKTPLEAAIAYNRAIDILQKNGFQKKYQPNYIEGISPSRYADIYSGLKISPKILSLKPDDFSTP